MTRIAQSVRAVIATALVAASVPALAVDTINGTGSVGMQRALVHAEQGLEALRRFVERTRSIYQLDLETVARAYDARKAAMAAAASPDSSAAVAKAPEAGPR